jgi:homoserine O-acetyltransferase
MMIEAIRNDPDYKNGDYVSQPRFLKIASVFYGIATAGGTLIPTPHQSELTI